MKERAFIYILFNRKRGTLYSGVTSDLLKRIYEHKNKITGGFTAKYNIDKLGYYEIHTSMIEAIKREKQLKKFYRHQKIILIEKNNPDWHDLYYELCK